MYGFVAIPKGSYALYILLCFRYFLSVGRRNTLWQVLAFSGWLLSDLAMYMDYRCMVFILGLIRPLVLCVVDIVF